MSQRVDAESGLKDENGTQDGSIEESTAPVSPAKSSDSDGQNNSERDGESMEVLVLPLEQGVRLEIGAIGFSNGGLVLLDEQPSHVSPEESTLRIVGILIGIDITMMSTVIASPPEAGALEGRSTAKQNKETSGPVSAEGTMGEHAMITNSNSETSSHIANHRQDEGVELEGSSEDSVQTNERSRQNPDGRNPVNTGSGLTKLIEPSEGDLRLGRGDGRSGGLVLLFRSLNESASDLLERELEVVLRDGAQLLGRLGSALDEGTRKRENIVDIVRQKVDPARELGRESNRELDRDILGEGNAIDPRVEGRHPEVIGQEGKEPELDESPDSNTRKQHGEEDGREEIDDSSGKDDALAVARLHRVAEEMRVDRLFSRNQKPVPFVGRALFALNTLRRHGFLLLLQLPRFEGDEQGSRDESADDAVDDREAREGAAAAVMADRVDGSEDEANETPRNRKAVPGKRGKERITNDAHHDADAQTTKGSAGRLLKQLQYEWPDHQV